MASETIEFLASFVIIVTVITGGILNATQYLGNAFNYDVDQSTSSMAKDMLIGLVENTGAPLNWIESGVKPTVFGLKWTESASPTPNPFAITRMLARETIISYGGMNYYDLSKNGFNLYYNEEVCLSYDDVKNLVNPNNRYDLQISFKPVLTITSEFNEPTLSIDVWGPSGPVTGATVLVSIFEVSAVAPEPLSIERIDLASSTVGGDCSFDITGVSAPFFAYIRVNYGSLSSTSYYLDSNLDEAAVVPLVTDYENAEISLVHRRDIDLYSSYAYSGDISYNSTFLIPLEESLLYTTNLSSGTIEFSQSPVKASLTDLKSTPGVVLIFYEIPEGFGLAVMPWGANSLGIETTFGGAPDHVVNVVTQDVVSKIGSVSYTTGVKLWRDIISTETVSAIKNVTVTSNPEGTSYVMVDGIPITTPHTFQWLMGDVHDVQAASIVVAGSDMRYRFIGWSDGGEESHQYTVTSSTTLVANYKTQYEVIFDIQPPLGGTITPSSTAFYDAGSEVSLTASPNTDYGFESWASNNGATTFSVQEINTTATIGGPCTIRANFIFGVVSITITSDPTGSGMITVDGTEIATPHTFNWIAGESHTIQANSPIPIDASSRYAFSGWSDGGTQTHNYVVSIPSTLTASFETQYLVQFTSFGLDASTNGTIVTVDGSPLASLPYSKWYNNGTITSYSFASPVDSLTVGKQFRLSNVAGPVSGYSVTAPTTINGVFIKQYQVTFFVSPPGYGTTDPAGTNIWVDDGTLPISATSSPGHIFSTWSSSPTIVVTGPISPITTATISGPGTITANFANGPVNIWIKSNPSGAGYVVVDGSIVTTPAIFSWSVGSTHVLSANTLVDGVPGTRYEYSGWSDAGDQTHDYYVSAAANVTANFKTQYYWMFTSTGLDASVDASSVVVNAGSIPITYGQLPYTDWFDSGTPYSYSSNVASTSGKRFSYVAPTSLVPPSGGESWWTVTGNYQTQYQVVFQTVGLDASAIGTVVTVAGSPIAASSLPYTSGWVNSGSTLNFLYSSEVSSSPGKRFILVSTSNASPITVNSPMTVSATYKIQYKVTLERNRNWGTVTPYGDVWVDSGTNLSIRATPNSNKSFSNWSKVGSITIANANSASTTATINGSGTITANFS
jgi:hypothetical protein